MRLVTAREMQAIDRSTIDGGHVSSLALMERAGQAAAAAAFRHLQSHPGRVLVVCGKGNNGGDGLVVARILHGRGAMVAVHLTHPPADLSPDARTNHAKLSELGVPIELVPDGVPDPGPVPSAAVRPGPHTAARLPQGAGPAAGAWLERLAEATLVVDALLGTGVAEPLRGRLAAIVNCLGWCSRQTLALDIPSGVEGDTGRIAGTAVWADRTVTFGLPKLGLVLHPGRERAGTIEVADIGFPASVVDTVARDREWVDERCARGWLPHIGPTAHKYDRGSVLCLAGSRAYTGAAALAATAALRAGAGIVHLVVPDSIRPILQAKVTEVIVHGVDETEAGTLSPKAEAMLLPLVEAADGLVVGPGLGSEHRTLEWIRDLLGRIDRPVVVDADAIGALPDPPHPGPRIATPHAGELARWRGTRAAGDLERLEIARRAAEATGVVVLAKGAPTCVAAPDGRLYVNSTGHVGLATAGSGDVLAGIAGALAAQRCEPAVAAALAAYLHGRAAELATVGSPRSLLAGDLLVAIGRAIGEMDVPRGR